MKQIFGFIKYSKDKEKLRALVRRDQTYRALDEEAYDMVAAYSNTSKLAIKKESYGKDGKVDMCKAIDDMCQDSWNDGNQAGIEQGIELFVQDHQEDGTPRERVLDKLIRRFGLTQERAENLLLKHNY